MVKSYLIDKVFSVLSVLLTVLAFDENLEVFLTENIIFFEVPQELLGHTLLAFPFYRFKIIYPILV